jgi:hypothetical protein
MGHLWDRPKQLWENSTLQAVRGPLQSSCGRTLLYKQLWVRSKQLWNNSTLQQLWDRSNAVVGQLYSTVHSSYGTVLKHAVLGKIYYTGNYGTVLKQLWENSILYSSYGTVLKLL